MGYLPSFFATQLKYNFRRTKGSVTPIPCFAIPLIFGGNIALNLSGAIHFGKFQMYIVCFHFDHRPFL